MGKFVMSTRKNGETQFTLVAGNGQTILNSEGYSSKAACENGVESVRKNAAEDGRYELLTASNGKFYFNLKAGNGQVIGTSQMYADENGRSQGMASVKANAPDASVDDQTT